MKLIKAEISEGTDVANKIRNNAKWEACHNDKTDTAKCKVLDSQPQNHNIEGGNYKANAAT